MKWLRKLSFEPFFSYFLSIPFLFFQTNLGTTIAFYQYSILRTISKKMVCGQIHPQNIRQKYTVKGWRNTIIMKSTNKYPEAKEIKILNRRLIYWTSWIDSIYLYKVPASTISKITHPFPVIIELSWKVLGKICFLLHQWFNGISKCFVW
jgi:hypothetical protein